SCRHCELSVASRFKLSVGLFVGVLLAPCGCTSLPQWVQNGFKVGPNYGKPPAAVADDWIDFKKDPKNRKLRRGEPDLAAWWCVFDDPILNELVQRAYSQNLTVRAAGYRILQARAQVGIAVGEIMPQLQTFNATYSRNEVSLTRSGTVNVGSSGA